MIAWMFHDRTQAGAALAAAMPELRKKSNVTVIGLARGGVAVAAEHARLLDLPLDVLCVRKVGTPGHPELAMGGCPIDIAGGKRQPVLKKRRGRPIRSGTSDIDRALTHRRSPGSSGLRSLPIASATGPEPPRSA